ncbi:MULTISPECIES: hypothetical protein [unclassified Streptomyces]|uniref:hypothetical protein n=1 Tax=unclassified Streptomyces TaxID=2593676 RepID=UPI00202FDB7D|nr:MULTISPECIES: hypothetical protein [unclassified Streptomyces]MCM1970529.1 hypothetical protein [Streptomyces sp. G1]MCX5295019.1 hypothetical protein [Streptomyces sp. NBC_00193]
MRSSSAAIRGRSVRGLRGLRGLAGTQGPSGPRGLRALPAAAAAAAVLALAGCSADAPAPEVAGGDRGGRAKPQDDNAVRRAWVDCMHQQGQTSVEQDKDGNIGFPAASTDTGMPSGYDAASRLCDEKVPGIHQIQQADSAKYVEMARKWVECARKNGYSDMPDPDPEEGVVVVPRAVFDPAKWDAAARACDAQFPLPGYRIGE